MYLWIPACAGMMQHVSFFTASLTDGWMDEKNNLFFTLKSPSAKADGS